MRDVESTTRTTFWRGVYDEDPQLRAGFLAIRDGRMRRAWGSPATPYDRPVADDDHLVSDDPTSGDREGEFLRLYDRALPEVYGYLLVRCRDPSLAEDLTAETFHAAVSASRRGACSPLTTPWLVGVARHKLVDHWRRQAREERALTRLQGGETAGGDGWEEQRLDAMRARATLARLNPAYRAALTLHYADGLTTAEVAALLNRTLHATEALLVRARTAFRRAYAEGQEDG